MAEIGTLNILGEIQYLVSDQLQVVSYKWLSRNFSVSSNEAKRILMEFVEQNGSGLEIVYTVSGWLKDSDPVYHVRLVSGVKLAEVKKKFEGNCSLQVYSVQPCIPKDPAALWNSEFVQAEELFNQPSTIDNCLRDNRIRAMFWFGSVVFQIRLSYAMSVEHLQVFLLHSPKLEGSQHHVEVVVQFKLQLFHKKRLKVQQSSPKIGHSPVVATPVIKSESTASGSNAQAHTNTGKVAALPATKKKPQSERSSSGAGGSLANMWGRASVKSKPTCLPETSKTVTDSTGNLPTAEAQICASEAIDTVSSDDDDVQCVNHKRVTNGKSNRNRRVVFDFSDEDDFEDAVCLASADPPKEQSNQNSESNTKTLLVGKNNSNVEMQSVDQSNIKQETTAEREITRPSKEDEVIAVKNKTTEKPVKIPDPKVVACPKDQPTEDVCHSTKRRRVLKTRIDERGREVTEVGWEAEELQDKNSDKKDAVTETTNNRPSEAKKSPALASNAPSIPVGKAGAKKSGKGRGVKDAKQGNIMSFFKKV
ncbi:hypothetical protein IFM89_004729 [Coptis chinensis]|uniref:DNA polymerase delta subunit 3 n=1 Tax=Coptis chinensis TaxID=261450 RepID=A0A835LCS8_9MAGN|nr:hypothetical protein IFM89_004729 [Coptis chinensis]